MRSKDYWDHPSTGWDPFTLPKRIARGLALAFRNTTHAESATALKYLWLYVNEEGNLRPQDGDDPSVALEIDDWLNAIDESAALGLEWIVISAGASLSSCESVWEIGRWAQEVHGLNVGIHITDPDLSEQDIEHLLSLDPAKTHLIADETHLDALRPLEARGLQICSANIRPDERGSPCLNPQGIACVGKDGALFSCGLVLRDEEFALGNVHEHRLETVMNDDTLRHFVPDTDDYPLQCCNACPPLMAKHVAEKQKI
ncbi:MAG: SPASM domain-containing protein [Candidatus Hydrogenedentes bacterium]|nr:SPASM domain-containing protein [Candidatus Hydrogenedentota bacterium]